MSRAGPGRLLGLGCIDLKKLSVSSMPSTNDKIGFLAVNTYIGTRYSLGEGPMNDAVSMAKMLTRAGYKVYFIENAKKSNFLEWLRYFFKSTSNHLISYYVGHGTTTVDKTGDEADGKDEAFFFEDGILVDDILIETLIDNKHQESTLTLITDACHSGSVWDIQGGNVKGRQLPSNIISISAASDKQTAKQTMVDREEQGIFTSGIKKLQKFNTDITPNEIRTQLGNQLKKYQQTINIGTTSPELLNQPLIKH